MEAEVRVEGASDSPVAFMAVSRMGLVLGIARDRIYTRKGRVDTERPVDMTKYRCLTLRHRRGLLEVSVDGQTVIREAVWKEETPLGNMQGSGPLGGYTHFGQVGHEGRSYWRRFSYAAETPTHADYSWSWRAADGTWPDDYQRRRLTQIHANHPDQKPGPDHGYSSWLSLADGRILLVDYTNFGDVPNTSHLVGVYIDPEDIV
jgi:hypothetical protein